MRILEKLLILASSEPEDSRYYLSRSEIEDVLEFFESQIKLEQSQNPEGSMTLQGYIDELPG
jgi:hypothetical protein